MKNVILSLIISFAAIQAYSQNTIITDRPDQTESAAVIAPGGVQVETGFVFESTSTDLMDIENMTYNTTLFRIGVLDRLEFRLGFSVDKMTTTNKLMDVEDEVSGFSPLHTGMKVKLAEENGLRPEIALLAGLDWPATAAEEMKPTYVAPSLRLAFAHTLSDRFSLGYNLGAEWDGDDPYGGYFYSVALGVGITDHLGMFVESYGNFMENNDNLHQVDAGFTYLVQDNFQLDISGGLGLSETAPDYFASFGFSYLFRR